jgi:type I restriction enzyme, R subunit
MSAFNESIIEDAALDYLRQLGYTTAFGPEIAPSGEYSERASYGQIYLYDRLREAALRINATARKSLVEEAIKRLERAESQNPVDENFRVHKLLTEGVPVEYRDTDG